MPHHQFSAIRHPSITAVVEALISGCPHPARLLELYYWSTAPGMLPIVRSVAAMSNETRSALDTFLQTANPKTVTAHTDSDGRIELVSASDCPPVPVAAQVRTSNARKVRAHRAQEVEARRALG